MRNLLLISLFTILFSCGSDSGNDPDPDPNPVDKELIKGVDISFLPEIEAAGVEFYNAADVEMDMLDILKAAGVNTIRLRLWHTPATEHSSLAEVKTFSERIKAKGFKVWLSVHYSDTWADPGNQAKPAAWTSASFTELQDHVYEYTKTIMEEIDPDIIQIGNEINGGFLLPTGSTNNLSNFIALLKDAIAAVRQTSSDTKIMIHLAGFDNAVSWVYQQLKDNTVDYDLIGLSYYPIWHGKNLDELQTAINTLGAAHNKQVVIAETAYPFSFGFDDFTNNIIGSNSQILAAYPATVQGQKNYLLKIREMVTKAPKGIGFCYWGAEWVSFKGDEATDGSTWENQALFNFSNKAVPALEAFADEE